MTEREMQLLNQVANNTFGEHHKALRKAIEELQDARTAALQEVAALVEVEWGGEVTGDAIAACIRGLISAPMGATRKEPANGECEQGPVDRPSHP